ncbi:TAXI family TRAP transporter solute-binding subunit [Tropicimonas aquimaris]|uniref:TAXI family TRAP transporter solute-binding subunit n=1 Tax=Tropicimonas aquimaris TaxID=914152 RepID=A0ABW3IP14_9RHOB
MDRISVSTRRGARVVSRGLPVAATVAALALGAGAAVARDITVVTFGSASLAGTYHAVVGAICDLANRTGRRDLRCSPEPTPGSVYNLLAMQRGELDFALVQSDWQRRAVEGTGPFAETGPMEDLRGVMSLYPEAVTLLVRKGAGINGIEDLAGKTVDIGDPVIARRATNERLLAALELSDEDRAKFVGLAGSAVRAEFCRGAVDAVLLVLGHPNASVQSALSDCNGEIVSIRGPVVDALLAESSDFARTEISSDTYGGLFADIDTISVSATLVTRADTSDETVDYFSRMILDNLGLLATSNPVLRERPLERLKGDGMTAALHPAAEAVFAAKAGAPGQ